MDGTIPGMLRARAADRGEHLFVSVGDYRATYAEMNRVTDAVAAGFFDCGVEHGERVAILSVNRPEILELYFGLAKIGAVQVPLNAFLKGEFLRYQLADSQASTLVVDSSGYAAVVDLVSQLPDLKRIVLLDGDGSGSAPVELVPYRHIRESSATPPETPVVAADVMSIVYTSGTTGFPKGCVLTHGYYLRVGRVGVQTYELGADDVMISALPLFHAAARMLMVAATLTVGATAVVEEEFHGTTFLDHAAEAGATVVLGVAAMFAVLLMQPPSGRDRRHRLRLAVWTPASIDLATRFHERFGVEVNSQLYGQTECAGVTYSPASQPRNAASAGRAAPDLEVRVVDDEDREVPAGEVGEIVFRPREPHAMFREYWQKPAETLLAFRTLWYHTGDFGRRDTDGFFYFVDRKKDAMRRRGENVSSMELETAIAAHPKIAEAAAHAVPSALTEDDIKACLVLKPGETVEPEEVFAFFHEKLPYFAVPRYVEVLEALPKNAVHRVMKHVLRERGITSDTWDFEALDLTIARTERR